MLFLASCVSSEVVSLRDEPDAGPTVSLACRPGEIRACDLVHDPGNCCGQVHSDDQCTGDGFTNMTCDSEGTFVCPDGRRRVADCTSWWSPEPLGDEDGGMRECQGFVYCAPSSGGKCFGDVIYQAECTASGTHVCPPGTTRTTECTWLVHG